MGDSPSTWSNRQMFEPSTAIINSFNAKVGSIFQTSMHGANISRLWFCHKKLEQIHLKDWGNDRGPCRLPQSLFFSSAWIPETEVMETLIVMANRKPTNPDC